VTQGASRFHRGRKVGERRATVTRGLKSPPPVGPDLPGTNHTRRKKASRQGEGKTLTAEWCLPRAPASRESGSELPHSKEGLAEARPSETPHGGFGRRRAQLAPYCLAISSSAATC